MILYLPISAWQCGLAVSIWCLSSGFLLVRGVAAQRNFNAVRLFAGGAAKVLDGEGRWQPVALTGGSVLAGRFAWLRFRDQSGRLFQELMGTDRRQNREWRRLHIIWRFIGVVS